MGRVLWQKFGLGREALWRRVCFNKYGDNARVDGFGGGDVGKVKESMSQWNMSLC